MISLRRAPARPRVGSVELPHETTYGSVKRLNWIRRQLAPGSRIADVGCGTGYMLTLPLHNDGFDIQGVDLDTKSVALGKQIFAAAGVPADRLVERDLREIDGEFDAVIVSEVFEHQLDPDLDQLLDAINSKLKTGGRLFVTVPNGRGWFEKESALWYKRGAGKWVERFFVVWLMQKLKILLTGSDHVEQYPSSLEGSPHVQCFSFESIQKRVEDAGYRVLDARGSVMFAGPFSNTFISGFKPLMRLNNWLGDRFPAHASGFFVSAEKL